MVAGRGWLAEVLAKAALLRGSAHPFDLTDGVGEALVVDRAGAVACSAELAAFLGDVPASTQVRPSTL